MVVFPYVKNMEPHMVIVFRYGGGWMVVTLPELVMVGTGKLMVGHRP